jgi:hypothetical protein
MKDNKTRFQMDVKMDARLHKALCVESEKMFKTPTRFVVDVLSRLLVEGYTLQPTNQKTSLTNSKSKPKVEKRVWPRIPAPSRLPVKLTHNAFWRYNDEVVWAINKQGNRYMETDADADGQAFARGLWHNHVEPMLSASGIVVADYSDDLDWSDVAQEVATYLEMDATTDIPEIDAELAREFVEGFVEIVAAGDILDYVALNEGCAPKQHVD